MRPLTAEARHDGGEWSPVPGSVVERLVDCYDEAPDRVAGIVLALLDGYSVAVHCSCGHEVELRAAEL